MLSLIARWMDHEGLDWNVKEGLAVLRRLGLGNCVFYLVFVAHFQLGCSKLESKRWSSDTCRIVMYRLICCFLRRYCSKSSECSSALKQLDGLEAAK